MKGILTDETGDLKIDIRRGADGKIAQGIVVGDCKSDIAERVIRAWQGEFKEMPLIGGAVAKNQNGIISPFWCDDIQKQLKSIRLNAKVSLSDEGIVVEM
jgi:hypothetical protein